MKKESLHSELHLQRNIKLHQTKCTIDFTLHSGVFPVIAQFKSCVMLNRNISKSCYSRMRFVNSHVFTVPSSLYHPCATIKEVAFDNFYPPPHAATFHYKRRTARTKTNAQQRNKNVFTTTTPSERRRINATSTRCKLQVNSM